MHYFLHFCIHENALIVTQNAPVLQLLGAFAPDPSGDSASCIPAGGTASRPPLSPSTIFWIRHWSVCVCVCDQEDCGSATTATQRCFVPSAPTLNWSSSSAPSTDACVSVAVSRSTSAHCCSDQCAQLAVVSGQWEIDLGSLLQ